MPDTEKTGNFPGLGSIYTYLLTFNFFRFGEGAAAATVLLVGLVGVAVLYLWASRREEAA